MEYEWIVIFIASNISKNHFDQVWDLVKKEVLVEMIDYYKNYATSEEEFLNELKKIGSLDVRGWNFTNTYDIINILDRLKSELSKIKVNFEFSAFTTGLVDESIYYNSKTDLFDITFDDRF